MELSAVLHEVDTCPVEERLRLVEAEGEKILDSAVDLAVLERIQANPESFALIHQDIR